MSASPPPSSPTSQLRIPPQPQFYETLLDAISPAVIALDDDGAILHWNRCAADMFGMEIDAVLGQPFANFVSDVNASRQLFDRLRQLQSASGEIDVRARDGREMRLFVHAAAIRDANGAPVGVVMQGEHVGERQRGEAEQRLLAEVGANMSNSFEGEAVLDRVSRLIVPGMADACTFYRVDDDGTARMIASAYHDDELRGKFRRLDELRLDLGPPVPIAAVLHDGTAKLFEVTSASRREMARNEEEYELLESVGFSSAITVALRARGRTIGALGLGRRGDAAFDHRDLRLAEELARRAAVHVDNQSLYEAAVVANKSKSDFLAVISHELRTPLTTIMGYVELMASGVPEKLPPKATTFLERVRTAAWHLLGLIEQILIYARLEAGRENLMPESVTISKLLNDVRELIEPSALEKGLTFIVDESEAGLTVMTDLTKVRQILINLGSNAVKFTDAGKIHMGARSDGADIVMYVKDTGIGISSEHSDRIFDAFWQVDQSSTRSAGGAGLGLSVSRRLARLLGGDMTLKSMPGVGTDFMVRLPRAWRPSDDLTAT